AASIADEISQEFVKYMVTGIESERLRQLGAELRHSHSKKDIFTESMAELSAADQYFTCTLCRATVKVLANTFTGPDGELTGPNRDANAKKSMLSICDYFDIQTQEVCSGLFDLNWPIIDYIFNETIAEPSSICGMLPISICQLEQDEYNLNLTIVGDTPAESNSELAERSDKDLLVLHLTDIHYDPEYKVGSLADCDEPMCCRGDLVASSSGAGYWGDYRSCDTPKHLLLNALEHMAQHKIDWIYHTGDVPPHNVWSTTKQGNKDMLTEVDGLLAKYFPGIPVYPCMGNHEPHPTNVFGNSELPAELSIDWLYDHVWSLWKKWLPAGAEVTVRRGGYYTHSPTAGHRIVALNSMDCYLFNWWLFHNGSLVLDQLQWFHDTLLAAEKAGERVHVLTHIPSGDGDCWSDWAREYNRLLARFSKTISGIFNGHTHKDEMNLHYADSGAAVAVAWNGGSLTSYSYKNPNYRLYELNPDSWQVVEHHTWTFNLTEANRDSEKAPNWYKEYEFTAEFTSDTSPAGIDKLLLQMAKQPKLLRKFWRIKMTQADPKLDEGCDNDCLSSTLCRLATTNYKNTQQCRELQAILKESVSSPHCTDASVVANTFLLQLDKEQPEDEDDDDGAAALIAFSLPTVLLGIVGLRLLL
ncbi:hypothetical protein KR093_002107, partial [Drosophila rubida]